MVWDVSRNADCSFFLFLIFFHGVHGADFYTKPNRTVVAFIGSTQTFTWSLNLSAEEKTKVLEAQFGPWDERYKWVKSYFITFTRKPSGQENETKGGHTMARRLSWTGDLSRNYSAAFQLTNIQLNDTGKYGIKFTVRDFPPHDLYEWFLLSVEYPPVKPTADTRNMSLEVEEGKSLNITCRIITEGNPTIVWTRNKKISVQTGQSKLLFIGSVNRSQAGNYVCISMSPTGNRTSPITAVNVLYGPSIDETNKVVPVPGTKGALTTLTCKADGNPPPTFQWRTNDRVISEGVTRAWNSSTLAITPTNDEDFSHYVCTAKNRVGWDAITFNLHEKGPHVAEVHDQKALEDGDDTRLIKYLSISAVLAVVLVCAFLAQRYVAKRYRQRANQRRKGDPDEPQTWARDLTAVELNQRGIGVNPTFSGDAEWEIPRANLNVEKVIGHGAFGVVSRALALDLPGRPGWTVVAVKSVQEDASEKEKRDLLSEMSVLKNLEPHPHVIRLHGCVTTEARPLVVVEYAQYGDLLGYLRKSRGMRDNYYSDPSVKPQTSLTSRQLLKFAWEISDGMDYLSTKKIIHRDLAARNVLVGEEEVCKITDFGMARDVQEEDIYVRTHEGRLPIKWTAPEALFGSGAYTTASDVWSYGVVLYEIFTVGGDPFPGVYMREIPTLLKNGYRMSRPKFVSPKLHEIMMECWNNEPSHRPSFAALRSTLHDMKEEEEQEYINLEELFYENVLPTSCLRSTDDERQETCI